MTQPDTGRFANVLITGASSGIGAALARALARPGAVLHLCGRNEARLAEVTESCRARGATVHAQILDVVDPDATEAWIRQAGYLDLVVANAGISAGTGNGRPETEAQARAIFSTNLGGVLNTVLPAIATMQTQPETPDGWRGHIAVVASIAAFIATPGAPAYSASKAAADSWTVATATVARTQGIHLASVCPGYVRTNMTARNRFPMPGLMSAEKAASIILHGLARSRRRIAFPWWMYTACRLIGLLPLAWSTRLLNTVPGKDALDA